MVKVIMHRKTYFPPMMHMSYLDEKGDSNILLFWTKHFQTLSDTVFESNSFFN